MPATAAPGTPPTTAPAAPAVVDEGLVRLGAMFDDEGALPLDAALSIYAALVAPLPGIEPVADAGDLPVSTAALAVRRLMGALDQLGPEVATVIEEQATALTAQDPDDIVIEPGRAAPREGSSGGGGSGVVPTVDELAEVISGIVADLEAASGHALRIPVRTRLVATAATWDGLAVGATGGGDRVARCVISIQERVFANDTASATSTLAHEVWHCFQFDTNAEAVWSGPIWKVEGQAEWAGEAYVGGSPSSASQWNNWLLDPEFGLASRSYDAIGLYAVAAAHGIDPWTTMLPMLGQATPRALSTLFGGADADTAIGHVATALTRLPEFGADWESSGPGITGAEGAEVMDVPTEGSETVTRAVARFASFPVVLLINDGADILRVAISGGTSGAVAVPDAGAMQIAPGGHVDFCMRPEGCVCPDGTYPGGGDDPLPSARAGVGGAAAGSTERAELSVTAGGRSLEEACSQSIVGEWATSVSAVYAVLSAAYGGGGPDCDGPYRATFTEDGLFAVEYQATCTLGRETGSGHARFDGTYTTEQIDGQWTFSVHDITGEATITMFGTTRPLEIIDGYRQMYGGPVPYSVVDDVLTYSFTAPDGNTFTISMTRVA